ncbi:hypothetical protein IFM89_028164 [Coptis chinensis]|uniref:GTD-binding domain-containing protein n=1 Tax=Coptis chinensis TaxID=261450 RepID=A0A835LSR2_9MAGN|nr:hypothetical protein IFM89_028164 [Coptis chinensis]
MVILIPDDNEAHAGIQSDEGPQHSFRWNDFMGESKNFGRDMTSASDVEHSFQQEMGSDRSDINSIRVLEQALEEEHTARAALYQELEKERSAAASAADEAMAMILRLQKEKASVEMEAKQYQRMIEEKSAYDEEEMNILKEILVRREREVHFLEKEVEAYRMTTPRNENLVGLSTQTTRSLSDSSEDPELMLQQISEYIDKKEMVKNMKNSSNTLSVEKQGRVLTFEEGSPPLPSPPPPRWHEIDDLWKRGDYRSGPSNDKPESISEYKHKFQEKGLLSVEEKSSDPQGQRLMTEVDSRFYQLNEDQEHNLLEKTIIVDEEQGKNDNAGLCQGMAVKTGQTGEITIGVPHDGANLEKHGNDADQGGIDRYTSISEAEPTVLDVHVIDDRSKLCNQGSEEEAVSLLINTATDRRKKSVHQSEASGSRRPSIINDHLSTSRGENQSAIRRSMSDMRSVSDKSQGKKLPLSDMRRNSMSSVDCERSKLESEVGWLRERLKIVQEGREKLSFSVEHREREKLHLQLLEDIAKQLKEIRHLTEPVKSVRQASLPPSSSKVHTSDFSC